MLGFLDLKTGVTLVVLFAVRSPQHEVFSPPAAHTFHQVLNKVAGIYGLIALLTGAGGSAAQLTLYIYSAVALVALTWGIRAVNDVRSTRSLILHLYLHWHHTGEPEAHALLCPHILRRSCP